MATVAKRIWTTKSGLEKTAWVCSYVDRDGQQHRRQFRRKGDADGERVRIEGELAIGAHIADRNSKTVLEAGQGFVADFQLLVHQGKREHGTLDGYDWHVRRITEFDIATMGLSRLTGPDCLTFARELEQRCSEDLAKKILVTFKAILKHALARGWMVTNPADGISIRTGGPRLEKELEIPSKAQLKALLEAAEQREDNGMAAALVSTLLFSGLRVSELRGLLRADIDLSDRLISVHQRADKRERIGPVKSKNSRRVVPVPNHTVRALRAWMITSPHSELDLVFPNKVGKVKSYAHFRNRLWLPLLETAGLMTIREQGGLKKKEPLFGFHALRHAAVSLWIEQGASPKKVMTWAGHASIQFTMDVYGHLWDDPAGDQQIASAIERSILKHA